MTTSKFRTLLVANRGEIAIRVFRSAHEIGIRAIALYTYEDRFALHRFKADESYQVGQPGEPVKGYLNIPEIIKLAKRRGVDAIHPGYGFLSENADFARACQEAGITFIGPRIELLDNLGDKVKARAIAKQAGVPTLEGSEVLRDAKHAQEVAAKMGFPIMLKAVHGGGGRGMRVARTEQELAPALEQAQREAQQAFGNGAIFIEKFITQARHIEVQLLGDHHGNLVHLWERDCSIQRRHQKVVELAPSPNLPRAIREALCQAAVTIGKMVNYDNAGTVEFLYDASARKFYFIEVNPRIQVEHTVTEAVTGIDIVARQIHIAAGQRLDSEVVGLGNQEDIKTNGYAIQCRVTTEDPENNFIPDYGRISLYRSSGGMGIRLDAGTAFSGAIVTPFFDSLLVKVTAWGHRFPTAASRMLRVLNEFRIRGVKTNIPFLRNLLAHPTFLAGNCTTRFLDEAKELFDFPPKQDRASKLLSYLAEVTLNGHPNVAVRPTIDRRPAVSPTVNVMEAPPQGTKHLLSQLGPKGLADWVFKQKKLLLTDTTMRDAHQSLLATRLRTFDMVQIAEHYAHHHAELFSLEMWGGATFDTAMRFLAESPWQRLADLRAKIPNILFQMLLRSANAVGYTTYPDNVVRAFIHESAQAGIDIFRIFDSLNWVENMRLAMEAVLETDAVCEAAICYTGDILNPKRTKYDLRYYVNMAKQLEKLGAHMLAIKDMAGLCKPAAAALLVKTLKQEVGIPIHFHTHDTAGIQAAAILQAAEVGLDIADVAMAPLSGTTSQVNLNSIVEALRYTDRATGLGEEPLEQTAIYWERVRQYYLPFESGLSAGTAEVYASEIPGGQYTNLQQQAKAVGLGDRFPEVCRMYAQVNLLFGDIVKVTPTSKVVGDMALFMVSNNYTPEDVLRDDREIAFPDSVIEMFEGRLGQPPEGWPAKLQAKILKGRKPLTGRPGASMEPVDLEQAAAIARKTLGREPTHQEVLSSLLYPRVFTDFVKTQDKYSDPSILPTPLFFYGLEPREEVSVDIEPGKTLMVKLTAIGEAHPDGMREVFFELNGQPREIRLLDRKQVRTETTRDKADADDPKQVGSPMPGLITTVAVKAGQRVAKWEKLATLEAMKMETTLYAEHEGLIAKVLVAVGDQVKQGDLLFVFQ